IIHASNQPTQIKLKNQSKLLEGIPFGDNTFDYAFQRYLASGYPKENWPDV
ncbi:23120_t:CDS:1, partial [Gigaspora rosea]